MYDQVCIRLRENAKITKKSGLQQKAIQILPLNQCVKNIKKTFYIFVKVAAERKTMAIHGRAKTSVHT